MGMAIRPAILPMLLPIIIIGGVRIGVFTANEAGTVAIVYALALGVLYHEMKLKNICQGLQGNGHHHQLDYADRRGGVLLSWVLTREQIPQTFANWMTNAIDNKYIFLLVVNIFLIIVGMFVEGNASMIVLGPLLHPVALAFGIDPGPLCNGLYLQLHNRCVHPADGYADVRHLRYYQVSDQGLYQGSGTVLYPGSRPISCC